MQDCLIKLQKMSNASLQHVLQSHQSHYFLISAPSSARAGQHTGKQHFHHRKMLSNLTL